jgi:hypothetical protein
MERYREALWVCVGRIQIRKLKRDIIVKLRVIENKAEKKK